MNLTLYIIFLILYLYAFYYLIRIPKALWLVALNFILLLYQPFVKSLKTRYYMSVAIVIIFIVQAVVLFKYNKWASMAILPYTFMYAYQELIQPARTWRKIENAIESVIKDEA
jgi:hypothetical protein